MSKFEDMWIDNENISQQGKSFSVIKSKRRRWYAVFKCSCGASFICNMEDAASKTKSCGCWNKRNPPRLIHGHTVGDSVGKKRTSEFHTWSKMKGRILNPNNPKYHRYGGRGIKVCDRWLDFKNFYADMGNKPSGKTLERINNDGDYCKENCKWATLKEQANNTSTNVMITHLGITKTLKQWSEYYNVNYKSFWKKIRKQNKTIPQAVREIRGK